MPRFSRRNCLSAPAAPITIRFDAPQNMREAILAIAEECGLSGTPLRQVICQVVRAMPDQNNWSAEPVRQESLNHILSCPWHRVYDIVEAIYEKLNQIHGRESAEVFSNEFNSFLIENGIGWHVNSGLVETRGSHELDEVVDHAMEALSSSGLQTSSQLLKDARRHLSARPMPDCREAVNSAVSALEAVARRVTGEQNATFGEIVSRHSNLFPGALRKIAEGVWGYASEQSRHGREGQNIELAHAMQVVGLCAAMTVALQENERSE